jgi:hypothetical protein
MGIIGRMQGDKKESNPAPNAVKIAICSMILAYVFLVAQRLSEGVISIYIYCLAGLTL